jgi:hypothetical protein
MPPDVADHLSNGWLGGARAALISEKPDRHWTRPDYVEGVDEVEPEPGYCLLEPVFRQFIFVERATRFQELT